MPAEGIIHAQGKAQGVMSMSNRPGFRGVPRKGCPEEQPPGWERKDDGDYQGVQRAHRAMGAAPGRGSQCEKILERPVFSFVKGG